MWVTKSLALTSKTPLLSFVTWGLGLCKPRFCFANWFPVVPLPPWQQAGGRLSSWRGGLSFWWASVCPCGCEPHLSHAAPLSNSSWHCHRDPLHSRNPWGQHSSSMDTSILAQPHGTPCSEVWDSVLWDSPLRFSSVPQSRQGDHLLLAVATSAVVSCSLFYLFSTLKHYTLSYRFFVLNCVKITCVISFDWYSCTRRKGMKTTQPQQLVN